jgi:XTP/dITP diphosphohydrolase
LTRTIAFITGNAHKVKEASEILSGAGVKLRRVDLELEEPQADRVEDVARACALSGAKRIRGPALVEDSGLFISGLGGFPGPYSSYVHRTLGIEGILALMRGRRDRAARFESAVAYSADGQEAKVFKGTVVGTVSHAARGRGGFGFDPIFMARGQRTTFAELGLHEKNLLSHRGKAFRSLARWLSSE